MDKEDRTAMHLAAEKGHTATVEFLAGNAQSAKAQLADKKRSFLQRKDRQDS